MIKKIKSWNWNWASIVNSAIVVAFAVPILGYTKGLYDMVLQDHIFIESTYRSQQDMKTELTTNSAIDKTEHAIFNNDITNLKSEQSTHSVDIVELQGEMIEVRKYLHL